MKNKVLAPTILAVAAIGLLGFSAVGSTRAALSTQSDFFKAQVNVADIGVTLNENKEAVSYRNYVGGSWKEEPTGVLLENMLGEGEKLQLGKKYTEELSVTNSGSIYTYVRVIVDKSWIDEKGNKSTALSPELIDIEWNNSDWIIVDDNPSDERVVAYYKYPLAPDADTMGAPLSKTLSLDGSLGTIAHVETVDKNTVKTVYDYDGYQCSLEAEVDAVQAHNDAAMMQNDAAAITSAWGVTPSFSGTTLVGIN